MRILIAIGGSSHSAATLRLGAQIARRSDEPPTVLTVIKHPAERPLADMILARARDLLQPEVPNAWTRVQMGDPAEEIIREAKEGGYDLVVVGERQRRNLLTRFLRSSTAACVVKSAPCSVIVAKGKAGPIHRILLCDSGAESPSVGLCEVTSPSLLSQFTAQLAGLLEGEEEVTVLHVMSQMSAGPGVKGKQLRAGVEELIEEGAPEGELLEREIQVLERSGIHPHPKVRHGLVVDEIIKDARSGDYDLVVIGAHCGKRRRRTLLDDLTGKIVIRLDRPVLVVR